jgi:uncharacterized membrane protein YccF (DUF307 family)
MSPISLVLNLLWIVFGGIEMAAGWVIAAVIMAITIIGFPGHARPSTSPPTRSCRSAAKRCPAPNIPGTTSAHDIGTGPFGLIGNVLWLVLGYGWQSRNGPEIRVDLRGRRGA